MHLLFVELPPFFQPVEHELVGILWLDDEEVDQHRLQDRVDSLLDLLSFCFGLRLVHQL